MSSSYSITKNETFTITHARHIGSKVATDLLRFHRFYGKPDIASINSYEKEVVALLKHDYLYEVIYGFQRNDNWVEALKYRALSGGFLVSDDDPGKIRPGLDVTGAKFYSFLHYSSNWSNLSQQGQEAFREELPVKRSSADEPGIENGDWCDDLNYIKGGRGLGRSTIKRY